MSETFGSVESCDMAFCGVELKLGNVIVVARGCSGLEADLRQDG